MSFSPSIIANILFLFQGANLQPFFELEK
jgi:hypothetical protein